MKTTIRKQLFLLLTALFVGAIPANAQSLIRGDVNGDSEVTIADVTALVNYLHTGEFNMIARTLAFAENTTAVTKSYGDANFTIAATPDRGAEEGAITYASSETGVATINEITGEVTIGGVGETTITASITAGTNYAAAEASYTLTITIASISPTVTLEDWTYGSPNSPSVSGNMGNGTVTYYYKTGDGEWTETQPTDAGTHQVKASVAANGNYAAGETAAVEFTIAKATASVTTAPAAVSGTLVANGSAQALVTAGEATGGTLKYYVSTTNSAPTTETEGWTTTVSTGTDADTYYVWYYVEGDANHNSTAVTAISGESKTIYSAPEVVDLGLSVKWANMNIGATSVTDYGLYFAWGETVGRAGTNTSGTASDGYSYDWSNYAWSNGAYDKLTKYVPTDKTDYWNASGSPDNKTTLKQEDDAAYVALGESWKMPTKENWEELKNTENCTWEWKTNYSNSGVNGYLVISRKSGYTSNFIFLPAAGYRLNTYVNNQGTYGYYWSSSLDEGNPYYARNLYFYSGYVRMDDLNRCNGFSVRAVQ
mgnify:CR=1 FL=1